MRSVPLARCLVLALVLLAAAPAADAQDVEVAYGQGVLWRVEAADAPPSHVFGTVHSADPQVADLPAPVEAAFQGSARVVLEVVQTDDTRLAAMRAGVLGPDRDLRALTGAELFERIEAVGHRYGLPAAALRRFEPWTLIMLFSLPRAELALRAAESAQPLDVLLQRRAEAAGVQVHGLESLEEQVAVFQGLPMADQITLLAAAVAENARIDAWWRDLKALYLERDLGAIYRLIGERTSAGDRELHRLFVERLVDRRNARMVRRMASHLAAGRAFVAVGALHLPGERGILALLEQRGFRLTRVY